MFSDPQENIDKLDLDSGMKVVDVGAGSGHHTLIIAKRVGESGRVYAVDVQHELLARLKKEAAEAHLHNIEIVHGNAEKVGGTRLKDGIADRLFISNVLFQIEHREHFLKEMHRLLRPGGKLVMIDWSTAMHGTEHAAMIVGPLEAAHLLEGAGLSKEAEFDAGSHHWGIIAKKI